jgi:hypothetical protein
MIFALLAFGGSTGPVLADGCYICTSGSACAQCAYRGSDSQENRKRCREAGCTIGGTKSCSTAANVKTCRASLENPARLQAVLDWLLQ